LTRYTIAMLIGTKDYLDAVRRCHSVSVL
jgi:hypothetical protein